MTLTVQLFSARNFLPWDLVLDQIRAAGFDGVEGFGPVYADAQGFRRALKARGLTMPSGHFALAELEGNFDAMIAAAKALGVKTIIAPWLPPEARPATHQGWADLGQRLQVLDGKVRDKGFDFAWHNHDFEMLPGPDGSIGMDILLAAAPGMAWEADLGWIFRAGLNPVGWLTKYRDRVTLVHMKDIQPNPETAPEGGWADLGQGINDWAPVFAAIAKLPNLRVQVAEHDNPADFQRFLRRWKSGHAMLSSAHAG